MSAKLIDRIALDASKEENGLCSTKISSSYIDEAYYNLLKPIFLLVVIIPINILEDLNISSQYRF